MRALDWLIMVLPLLICGAIAVYSRRFVRSVNRTYGYLKMVQGFLHIFCRAFFACIVLAVHLLRHASLQPTMLLPAACVVFVLIGAPIGMRVKRGGPAVAFMSIGFFLFYYACLVVGEELANRLILPAWFAMWRQSPG